MRTSIRAALLGVGVASLALPWGSAADEKPFEPIMEAELPEGFPGPTPVGTIEVKDYPKYRKATASGRTAFWTLFSHIKGNGIAMTAPVEMTYAAEEGQKPREQSMAFLYGSQKLGAEGKQGAVEVADVPAMTVVSIGVRGGRTEQSVLAAHERLRHWLQERESEYRPAGPTRVMGYNSPFVPRANQFFEVQIPVAPAGG